MYCSACGAAVTPGLSYCNRCGEKLNRDESVGKSSEVRPESLIFAMMATFVFGLGIITVMMAVMKVILSFNVPLVLGFGLFSFLIMLILEGVFISLLLRRRRNPESSDDVAQMKRATKELDAAQTQFLPQDRASVTEHTTRAFDPIYSERTPK